MKKPITLELKIFLVNLNLIIGTDVSTDLLKITLRLVRCINKQYYLPIFKKKIVNPILFYRAARWVSSVSEEPISKIYFPYGPRLRLGHRGLVERVKNNGLVGYYYSHQLIHWFSYAVPIVCGSIQPIIY